MTPERLIQCLAILGWSRRYVGEAMLRCNERAVRKWVDGKQPVPPAVAEWLERRVADVEADPAPDGWQDEAIRVGRPRKTSKHAERATR